MNEKIQQKTELENSKDVFFTVNFPLVRAAIQKKPTTTLIEIHFLSTIQELKLEFFHQNSMLLDSIIPS